jgi:flagellar basal body-associated protein FliL
MGNMAYVFFSGLTDITALILTLWGIMNIPFTKNKKRIALVVTIILVMIISAGIYSNINHEIAIICVTSISIIVVCFLFKDNIFKLIAYSLLAYLLAVFLSGCLSAICTVLNMNTDSVFMHYLYNIMVDLILAVIALVKRKKSSLQIHISRKIYTLLFTGVGAGMMIIAGLVVETNSKIGDRARRITIVIIIIIVISYCAACIMMVFITESRDSYKALSQINQRVIEAQQQYYTLVNEKQQEIRSIRHEMKNHLACIHGLYKADKLDEMEQYITQLIETSEVSSDLLDTGNDIVNAILNEAQSRYRKERIAIRLEGGFPPQLHIAPMDLCVIIANIISNAVEAIQRLEQKEEEFHYVDMKISSFKNELYINVRNPIDEKIHIVNGVPVTSKKDKDLHGFGISNVIQRVEKYQGSFQFHIENNEFCVEISLKNA